MHLAITNDNKVFLIEEYHRGWMHTTGGILTVDDIKLIAIHHSSGRPYQISPFINRTLKLSILQSLLHTK